MRVDLLCSTRHTGSHKMMEKYNIQSLPLIKVILPVSIARAMQHNSITKSWLPRQLSCLALPCFKLWPMSAELLQ